MEVGAYGDTGGTMTYVYPNFRLRDENGTVLMESTASANMSYTVENPGSGVHTYYMEMDNSFGGWNTNVSNRSMFVIEAKR